MPIKNSSTKAVRSFRLSIECVLQLEDIQNNIKWGDLPINLEYDPNSAN